MTNADRDRPVFILADDLTGSADAANYFRTERRRVRVTFDEDQPWDLDRGPDIVQVYDTESRGLSPKAARRRVGEAVVRLAGAGPTRVFKKVDSTLRGNLGIEIEAALRELQRPVAVLAPSFPANRRTVRDGCLLVDGIPLTQTAGARDPRAPVRWDRVADVVRATSAVAVSEIGLAVVRQGQEQLAAALRCRAEAPAVVVCDAETDGDLDTVVAVLATFDGVLPCGSAGLARAVASRWNEGSVTATTARPLLRPCSDVLIVVGSANPIAHDQLHLLARATDIPAVTLEPAQLATPESRDTHVARARNEVRRARGSLAITVSPERVADAAGGVPRYEADLAEIALAWVESRGPGAGLVGLVCTGGDTTLAVCRALGIRAIWPEGEISAGVPWSAVEGPARPMYLVTKAGGFGSPATLLDAVHFLQGGAGRDLQGVKA